ncbi:MAG: ATP-dependent DNA ligase [Desulfurococcaceae archaeon]
MSSTTQSDLPFSTLVEALEKISMTSSRIQMTAQLVELFKKTPPAVVDKVVYFLLGELWPSWTGLPELGVAEKMLIKAVSLSVNVPESKVEEQLKTAGDLGLVAEKLKSEKERLGRGLLGFVKAVSEQLTVLRVYNSLSRIARAIGEGSRDVKLKILSGLLTDASPREAKYIVRFIEGKLRAGIGEATIMDALSITYGGGAQNRPIVERAFNLRADLGAVAKILAEQGIDALRKIEPQVGYPIRPMLAERLSDPEEILDKVGGKGLAEFKYDGERAQIHRLRDKVWIFSRRLENITHQYPEVVNHILKYMKSQEAIVEGEIVAFDPDTMELKPFQELMHRKRKHDVHVAMKEYPVKVFLFDLLYADGVDYTSKPLIERKEKLKEIIDESDVFKLAEHLLIDNPQALEEFFLKAIESGCEGLVVKAIHGNAVYQAGARGWLWIKYKRDYKSEMIDTVDLVVVGAFYGRGRRGGKYGALLMAAYNPELDVFESVCKVGSGFSDEDLERMPEVLRQYVVPNKPPRVVVGSIEPDVWIEPALVAEVIGAEITLSPNHACAMNKVRPGAGLSIRFPRFIRWRPDKGPSEATTSDELIEMYKRQLKAIASERRVLEEA